MRWVLRGIGLIVVLVLVAGLSLLFLPKERIARIATDQLTALTGRDVAITGDLALTLWPVLGVRVEGLEIGGPDWAAEQPMISAAGAAIGVDARSLIDGDIHITHIEAQSPVIFLEQKADGRASWLLSEPAARTELPSETAEARPAVPSTAPTSEPVPKPERELRIDLMRVTNATVVYAAEGSAPVQFTGVDLALDWPDPGGAAIVSARVQPAGTPVSVRAEIAQFAAFIDGAVQAVDVQVDTNSGLASFEGQASTDGRLEGRTALRTADTNAFFRTLGLDGADFPAGLGQSLDLSTTLAFSPDGRVALRDLIVDLGGNTVRGAVDIALGDVPYIRAGLNAGVLDLRPAFAAPDPVVGSAPQSTQPKTDPQPSRSDKAPDGWSKDPIDASGLAAFDGEIALNAESIDLGTVKLGRTQTVLRNERSRMVFELQDVSAYGGSVTGEFVMNNRSGLSVGGRINAENLQMQPVLSDMIDFDRLTGAAGLRLSFLGVGETVDAIMSSLSGEGRMDVGRGTILGIDLDRLMGGDALGGGTTIFNSLNASWTMDRGVLRNDDLLLQLKNYEARGAGQVGLGAQTLDYTFTPVALRANSGRGLAIPIRMRGPWSDVSILPDLDAALDARVDEEVKALEEKAKRRVDEKIDEIVEDAEQSLEDEIKDRLLRKLFD